MTSHRPLLARPSARLPAACLLLAALCASACSDTGEAPGAGAGGGAMPAFRVPVTWTVAEAGEVTETVELVGDVVSRHAAELAFEREGRVVEVAVDIGQSVTRGAVLARLDDAVLRQEHAAAGARLAAAEARAAFATSEETRGRQAGDNVLSASELDRRGAEAATATAVAAESRAEQARLAELLGQSELRAPFDGVISARWIAPGSYAQRGQRAFAVTDLQHRDVHLEMPAAVATRLDRGGPVHLRADELPGLSIEARLDELVPAADAATRSFIVVARLDGLDPEQRLLPGMFVRARFGTRRASGQAIVPSDAIITDDRGSRIARVRPPDPRGGTAEDGLPPPPQAELVPVRILARHDGRAAVESLIPDRPLHVGDIVILTGSDNVWPDAPLSPRPPLGTATP